MFDRFDPPSVPEMSPQSVPEAMTQGARRRRRRHAAIGALVAGVLAVGAIGVSVPLLRDRHDDTVTLETAESPTPSVTTTTPTTFSPTPTPTGVSTVPTPTSGTSGRPSSGTPGASGSPKTTLVGVDWGATIRDRTCPVSGPDVELQRGSAVQYADVTGDGAPEAFIAAACRTTTSSNPATVYVYDGASSPAAPTRLAKLLGGPEPYLRDLTFTVSGKAVRIAADQISSTAPNCCPDRRYTQTWTWNGARFVGGTPTSKPLPDNLVGIDWADTIVDDSCATDNAGTVVVLSPGKQSVQYVDITGDGAKEAFIAASCRAGASDNPTAIYVYDGASRVTSPTRLAKLLGGPQPFLRNLTYTVTGTTVRLTADQVSENAPQCCADFRYTQTFRWNGSKFVAGTPTRRPLG